MKLNLLVLRTAKLEDMRTFYSALGARFKKERHRDGPEHYAATLNDDFVLELYPAMDGAMPDAGLRLGLRVDDIGETLRSIGQSAALHQTQWGLCALVRDPDGRTVELVESQAEAATAGTSHAMENATNALLATNETADPPVAPDEQMVAKNVVKFRHRKTVES
jgi:catechol 2,3-dioxygenase-like lactoylglutathione lyase family enzyme